MKRLIIEFEDIDEEGMKTMKQRVKNYVLDQAFSFLSSEAYMIKMLKGASKWVYWEGETAEVQD